MGGLLCMAGNIQQRKIVDDFNYSYYSIHSIDNKEITIYHLMLDFSKNIQEESKTV